MKITSFKFLFGYLILISTNCFSQDSNTYQTVYPSGIDLQIGTGYLAVRDDHISNEKYSGSLSWFAMQWSRYHDTYGYRIGMFYRNAPKIKNYNVSAKVTEGGFNVINLYPTGTFSLFSKSVFASFGPSADVFFYYRRQNIALNIDDGLDIYQSTAWLISLGGRAEATLLLSSELQFVGAMQLSIISLGAGTNNNSNSGMAFKVQTMFTGMHGSTEIGMRLFPIESVSLRAGYALEIFRINSWNFILANSDNVFLSLGYHF